MKYISTRNKADRVRASEGIVRGLSKNAGLYVPEALPRMDNINPLLAMNYQELAYEIMSKFFTDFSEKALRESINRAYDKKFAKKEIAPLVEMGQVSFLELFYGATFAFKDMALSILPYLLKEAMKNTQEKRELVILTATSGDTGKAALENFANISGVKIIVFFPEKGVSNIQKKSMLTQEGDNAFVVSIKGDFDDAQSGVKEIMNDHNFTQQMEENNYKLSSANSINIGRLIPQIVYYYHSYLTLLRKKEIVEGEKINFVVPTGNFGNILAAYYAKKMGLPIKKLICASNENNALTDFFHTGSYKANRKLELTSSPSMDILISSNLERLLFYLSGGDGDLIKSSMENLDKKKEFQIKGLDLSDFEAYFSTEKEVERAIRDVFKNFDYLMDPHTAVAYSAYKKYKREKKDKTKTVIVATASPFKFGEKVASSIGIDTKDKDDFTIIEELGLRANLPIPKNILDLRDKAILHKQNCQKEGIEGMILDILGVGNERD